MQSALSIFLLVTLGSLAGLSGGLLLLSKASWAGFLSKYSIPFAAGVMLAVAFLDLLPEAVKGADEETVFKIVLIVVVCAFFFEQFFLRRHHADHPTTPKSSVPLVVAGDTIHNFFDGVGIAVAYLLDPNLGVLVAAATFLHEIPHEIGDFGLMLAAGWKKGKVIVVNLFSALSSYLGAGLIILFSTEVQTSLNVLLAAAGGLLIYISLVDLLPGLYTVSLGKWTKISLFTGGVVLMWILTTF